MGQESQDKGVGRLGGLVILLIGLAISWVGYGMWRYPHLNWEDFLKAGAEAAQWLRDEAVRLWHDPFAIVGIAVAAGGLIVILIGIRKVFLGR